MTTPTHLSVWFITGAARGMGVDLARAALDAGHLVVAAARRRQCHHSPGRSRQPLRPVPRHHRRRRRPGRRRRGRGAVRADRHAGQQRRQLLRRLLRGDQRRPVPGPDGDQLLRPAERHPGRPAGHARAAQWPCRHDHLDRGHRRAGVLRGLRRFEVRARGLDGVAALRPRPYGISTTIVEPGFFRTELLVEGASSIWPELSIADYAQRTEQTIAAWKAMNGTQGGDPAKLARALVEIVALEEPPLRWIAGADAVAAIAQKAHELLAQADAHRKLSSSLDHDDA